MSNLMSNLLFLAALPKIGLTFNLTLDKRLNQVKAPNEWTSILQYDVDWEPGRPDVEVDSAARHSGGGAVLQ